MSFILNFFRIIAAFWQKQMNLNMDMKAIKERSLKRGLISGTAIK